MLSGIQKTRPELWDAYQAEIRHLFLKKKLSLPAIINALGAQGFVVTKAQLESQLKKWNLRRRIDPSNWVAIGHRIEKRRAANKDSAIWISGVRASDQTVARQTKRYKPLLRPATSPRLEPDAPVDIRTPPAQYTSSFIWPELPSVLFQNRLNNFPDFILPDFGGLQYRSNDMLQKFAVAHGGSANVALHAWVQSWKTKIPSLEQAQPESDNQALVEKSTGLKFRDLVKTLVFQLSNNLGREDDAWQLFVVLTKHVGPANLPLLAASRGLAELCFLQRISRMTLQKLCDGRESWDVMRWHRDPDRPMQLAIFRWVLECVYRVDAVDHNLLTTMYGHEGPFFGPMQVAILSMAEDVVELLLNHDTTLDSGVYSSETIISPLELALQSLSCCSHSECLGHRGSEKILRLLDAEAGGNWKRRNHQLLAAIRAGNLEVAKVLLDFGANLHFSTPNRYYHRHNFQETPDLDNLDICWFIQERIDKLGGGFYRDRLVANSTLLTAAAEFEIHEGPKVTPVSDDSSGDGPSAESDWHETDSEPIVLRLLNTVVGWMEGEVENSFFLTQDWRLIDVAVIAAARNHCRVLSWLIKMGVDVLSANSNGVSPFLAAIKEGNLAACDTLLDNGALRGLHGGFALHAAVVLAQNKVLKKLISAQADVHLRPNPQELKEALKQVDTTHDNELSYSPDDYLHGTALYTAVRSNWPWPTEKAEALTILICAGANLIGGELTFGARTGNVDLVRSALAAGASPNESDYQTCLQAAFSNNRTDIARILLQAGASFKGGELVIGARNGNADLVRLALAVGASPNDEDRHGTCLRYALTYNRPDIAKILLQAGSNLRGDELFLTRELDILSPLEDHGVNPRQRDCEGASLLERAYSMGDLALIGWASDRSSHCYDSGLVCAMTQHIARNGCPQTLLSLKSLLKLRGTNNRAADIFEGTALSLAALSSDPSSTIELLLSSIPLPSKCYHPFHEWERPRYENGCMPGVDWFMRDCFWRKPLTLRVSPLAAATLASTEDAAWLLSNHGIQPDQLSLLCAVSQGYLGLTEHFLTCGTQELSLASEVSEELPVPLLLAVETGNLDMVRLLVQHGYDPNNRPDLSFPLVSPTPLQKAALLEQWTIASCLIDAGADVNARPTVQCEGTALQFAAMSGNLQFARRLLDLSIPANVNAHRAEGEYGRTSLEGAAEKGRLDMVQLLLSSGAKISGTGQRQYLHAIRLAEENNHRAVSKLLRDKREWTCEDKWRMYNDDMFINWDSWRTTASECSASDCSLEHEESFWARHTSLAAEGGQEIQDDGGINLVEDHTMLMTDDLDFYTHFESGGHWY